MGTLAERLSAAIARAGMSQAELARIVGVSQPSVNDWLSGKTKTIRSAYLLKAAKALGVRPEWLSMGHGSMNINGSGNTAPGPDVRGTVPLISWVQAGNWADVVDELQPGEGDRVPTTKGTSLHSYALRVNGDSMEPVIPAGAIIIIDPESSPDPGKIVIVRQNGDTEATCKRLVSDGGRLYLKPENPRYPILEMRTDAVFCGVVKQVILDLN